MVAKERIRKSGSFFTRVTGLVYMLFFSVGVQAQEGDEMLKALVDAGFENVSRSVSGSEEIITFENGAWRAQGEGISEAMEIIDRFPLMVGKARRVVVLSNKIPQISLLLPYTSRGTDAESVDWQVSYRVGDVWKSRERLKFENDSRWKMDLLFQPQLFLRNQKYHKIYDVLFNIAPTLQFSPSRGMMLTGQLLVPVFNEYGGLYEDVRPGFLTVQQCFRVENVFVQATVGNFNQNRWGMDLTLWRPFTREGWLSHFALRGQMGLTGSSYFYDWNWHFGSASLFTWNVGGSYYNARYNVLCELRAEKYLAGDVGVRADMTRHFKRASIGFYIMKNDRDNTDGGFHVAILLPPTRYKRKFIRVAPSKYFTLEYKSAGLFYNGKSYKTSPGQNKAENNFNPYYIKSQLK